MVNKFQPRILFLAEAVTLAHIARPLALAGFLDSDYYDIHFAADNRYQRLYPDRHYTWHGIESIDSREFLTNLAKGRPLYDAKTLGGYVEEDLYLLREIQPDLVIGDFRLSLGISAPLTNIPYMSITNAYWSPFAQQAFPVPELPLTHIAGVRLSQMLFNLVRPVVFSLHTLPFNRVRQKYKLPALGYKLQTIYTYADHVLYADLPDLVTLKNLPSNHHFLGPVLWSPSIALPPWWERLPDNKPIVYITLGSSGRAELLQMILGAMADLPVTVIAATAGHSMPENIPNNAYVADYLPGSQAASRAAVVICNGGSPTTQQAIVQGVPVLGIVSNLDQHLNMSALQRQGAGLQLRSECATICRVREAMNLLLDSGSYRDAAGRLAEQAGKCVAKTEFPRIVKTVLTPNVSQSGWA